MREAPIDIVHLPLPRRRAVQVLQVAVPRRLFRLLQFRPLALVVGALTGVSVTAVPVILFWLGHEGARFWDWRTLLCLAVIYLVPFVYVKLGSPVLAVAYGWRAREHSSVAPTAAAR